MKWLTCAMLEELELVLLFLFLLIEPIKPTNLLGAENGTGTPYLAPTLLRLRGVIVSLFLTTHEVYADKGVWHKK